MTGVLTRRSVGDTPREDGHVRMEAEASDVAVSQGRTGIASSRSKPGRGQKDSSSPASPEGA